MRVLEGFILMFLVINTFFHLLAIACIVKELENVTSKVKDVISRLDKSTK